MRYDYDDFEDNETVLADGRVWVECWQCGGEGSDGHDCGEDTCCCLWPEDNVTCDICLGKGGWYRGERRSDGQLQLL